MGCGSSKTAQLTVAPNDPIIREVKPSSHISEIHTVDSVRTDNEVIESLQVDISEIPEIPAATPADTYIDKEVYILSQPTNEVTNNIRLRTPIEDELIPIEPHNITTETYSTSTDHEVLNFNNIWSYNCEAISERARVLSMYHATEPLNIKWCHITPNNSRLIPFWVNNASNLEAIDLSNNYIGPEGFRAILLALAYLPNLKSVNLSSNNPDKNCSTQIKNFISSSPSLEELDISCNELSGASFGRDLADGLKLAYSIVALNISGCGLVDIEPLFKIDSHCGFVKTVRRLDLSHNPINPQLFSNGIGEFMSKVQLKELSLNACDLTSHSMTKFTLSLLEDSTMLKLNTSSNKFSDKAGLVQLVTVCILHESMQELIASNAAYQEEKGNREYQAELASLIRDKLEETAVKSDLKKLTLSNCYLDGAALQIIRSNMLAASVELSELDLSYNFECIAENIKRFACVTKPGENILSKLECLTDGTNMGDNLIRLLRDGVFPSLKKLSLISSRISPTRVGNLSEFICKIVTPDSNEPTGDTPMLTELILDGIKLAGTNRSSIVNLFNAITFLQDSNAKVNWSLTSLSLNLCSLNDSDIKPIAQALNNGLRLEQLSLSYNRLGDSAVSDLTEGLANSKTIKMINLSSNRISSKGGTALADCLSRLSVERVLVAGNMIGPDGVLALINLTRICSELTLLDLRDQKAEFSDNYFELIESNIVEVIESRCSSGSNKSAVRIKLSGIECPSGDWGRVDSLNVETNYRKYKVTTLGLWEALTLLHCFRLASNPTADQYRRRHTDSYQSMREGMGELQLTNEEWLLILGPSPLPSWLQLEGYRDRGVFLSGIPVSVTQERLEGMLEAEANCRVVEAVMCKDSVRQEPNGAAWVLFEDRDSVVNAVELYTNGSANIYGNPYSISPLAVRIINTNNMTETYNMETVNSEIKQRAAKRNVQSKVHNELMQHKYEESQERHGKLLANPAYKGGRIW